MYRNNSTEIEYLESHKFSSKDANDTSSSHTLDGLKDQKNFKKENAKKPINIQISAENGETSSLKSENNSLSRQKSASYNDFDISSQASGGILSKLKSKSSTDNSSISSSERANNNDNDRLKSSFNRSTLSRLVKLFRKSLVTDTNQEVAPEEARSIAESDSFISSPEIMEKIQKLRSDYWVSPVLDEEEHVMNILMIGYCSPEHSMDCLSDPYVESYNGDTFACSSPPRISVSLAVDREGGGMNHGFSDPEALAQSHSSNEIARFGSQNLSPRRGSNSHIVPLTNLNRRPSYDFVVQAPQLPKKAKPIRQVSKPVPEKSLFKFNSCTTLFSVDNSLYEPNYTSENLQKILKSVAHVVKGHIDRTHKLFSLVQDIETNGMVGKNFKATKYLDRIFRSSDLLDESVYPIWESRLIPAKISKNPQSIVPSSEEEIYLFFEQLFLAADLTPEMAIISLIYLERMMAYTNISLFSLNCFRAILGAVMMASKIWEDQAVWNIDFKSIFPYLDHQGLNELEKWWLAHTNFDVSIKRSVYAQYWFEIRQVSEKLWGERVNQARQIYKAASREDNESVKLSAIENQIQGLDITNANKNIAQAREKRQNALNISLSKPMKESQMQKKSISTKYSQSKLREDFTESLLAPKYEFPPSRSERALSTGKLNSPLDQELKDILNMSFVSHKSEANINNFSHGGTGQFLKPSSNYQLQSGSSELSSDYSDSVNSFGQNLSKPRSTNVSNSSVNNRIIEEVRNVDWGGKNLRRTQSDNIYNPSVPNASVL